MEKLVRSIARPFWYKNCFGRLSKVFHKQKGPIFPQVFPQAISNPVASKVWVCLRSLFCTGASLKDCGYYLRFKGGDAPYDTDNSDCRVRQPAEYFDSRVRIFPADAPYAMSECVKRGSSFAADNVNSIAQLTQSLSQIRVSVPQLSNFVTTVKHSRVVFAAKHFANFRQTQTSMLPN